MKSYEELKEEFDDKVEKLQASCKHEDVDEWAVEWWALAHSTGWQTKVCKICNKIVARKMQCTTCGKDLVENIDVMKDVGGCWYCEECVFDAEEEEKKRMIEFDKIEKILPDLGRKLGKTLGRD